MHVPNIRRWCTFRVGDACFAVPTVGVVEVLRAGEPTRVPLAPASVLGLVHLRGRIVPVVDPAAQLGVDRRGGASATLLVLVLEEDWYAVAIDEMLDVMEIPGDAIERVGPAAGYGGDCMEGIFAAPGRLVHVLDPERMIHSLLRPRPRESEREGASHDRP